MRFGAFYRLYLPAQFEEGRIHRTNTHTESRRYEKRRRNGAQGAQIEHGRSLPTPRNSMKRALSRRLTHGNYELRKKRRSRAPGEKMAPGRTAPDLSDWGFCVSIGGSRRATGRGPCAERWKGPRWYANEGRGRILTKCMYMRNGETPLLAPSLRNSLHICRMVHVGLLQFAWDWGWQMNHASTFIAQLPA